MFSNLSKGSVLYGLDVKGDVKLFTAQIESVSFPRPRYLQNTFGQVPDTVVDIVANVNGERREFKQVPSNNAIADFGENAFILADNKDSLISYVVSLRQKSKTHIEETPKHERRIPQYDNILQELNPSYANNNSAVTALKEEVSSLKSQLAEAIALLKAENTKKE